MYFVYMLVCGDESIYCGYTNDLEARLSAHNSGKGAKYTKSRLPVQMVYHESFETKSEALKREVAIKKLSRREKMHLILYGGNHGKNNPAL